MDSAGVLWADMVPSRPLANEVMSTARTLHLTAFDLIHPWPSPETMGSKKPGAGARRIFSRYSRVRPKEIRHYLIDWLRQIVPALSHGEAFQELLSYKKALEEAINKNIQLVLAWHQFNPFHFLLAEACLERGLELYWVEHGLLPGTLSVEWQGQMSLSHFAEMGAGFEALDLSGEALSRGNEYLDWVRSNKVSRKLERPLKKSQSSRVLFLGSNDPRTIHYMPTSHTPRKLWESSPQLLREVLAVAESCQRGVDVRPHPMFPRSRYGKIGQENRRLRWLDSNDSIWDTIQQYDFVVTNYSQSQVIAVLRGVRPIVIGPRIVPWDSVLHLKNSDELHSVLGEGPEALSIDESQIQEEVTKTLEYFSVLEPRSENPYLCPNLIDMLVVMAESSGMTTRESIYRTRLRPKA